jgi:hypothetical protein
MNRCAGTIATEHRVMQYLEGSVYGSVRQEEDRLLPFREQFD